MMWRPATLLFLMALTSGGFVAGAAPARSGSADKIAFTSWRDGNLEIYVMNADGSAQLNVSQDAGQDDAPAWSPDGRWIAFASDQNTGDGDFEIYVIRPDGTGLRQITDNYTDEFSPTWSPDGKRIAYSSYRGGEEFNLDIFVIDVTGVGEVQLTDNPSDDTTPDWRPA